MQVSRTVLFDVPTFTVLAEQSHPTKHHASSMYELYLKWLKPQNQQRLPEDYERKIAEIYEL
jgi:hypothetical protein